MRASLRKRAQASGPALWPSRSRSEQSAGALLIQVAAAFFFLLYARSPDRPSLHLCHSNSAHCQRQTRREPSGRNECDQIGGGKSERRRERLHCILYCVRHCSSMEIAFTLNGLLLILNRRSNLPPQTPIGIVSESLKASDRFECDPQRHLSERRRRARWRGSHAMHLILAAHLRTGECCCSRYAEVR